MPPLRTSSAWIALLCLSVPLACAPDPSEERNQAARAPGLFDDREVLEAYLEEFPLEEYRIHQVPAVGRFYLDDNRSRVKRELREGRPWEPATLEEFRRYVVPGSTVIDVGAHIGAHTIPLAKLVGPEGRVYAFEPQAKVFRELFHNVRLNRLSQVVPLRFAVGAERGVVQLDVAPRRDGRTRIGRGEEVVEARTIDSFGLSDVSLMKVDVEGFELEVLRGAAETIRSSRPVIVVEIFRGHEEEARRLLGGYGYRVRPVGSGAAVDPASERNFVAIHRDGAPVAADPAEG